MIRFFEKDPYAPIEYSYEVSGILYSHKSKFQDIMVFENPYFGRILVLDGIVQLTEKDEFFYHEMLTHVVMHAHPEPRIIMVIGGGDGGTVREVLKHKTVKKVYFVEIDEEVINVSKKYFPSVSCEIDNPIVEIHTIDGAEFAKRSNLDIDIVIVDSTDIVGFATSLFTEEFFTSIKNCLNENGLFVTHSESIHFHKNITIEVQNKLKSVFPVVDLYAVPIATYGGNWWSFSIGSKGLNPRELQRKYQIKTRFYSDEIHKVSFLTPHFYKRLIDQELDW